MSRVAGRGGKFSASQKRLFHSPNPELEVSTFAKQKHSNNKVSACYERPLLIFQKHHKHNVY